ncbi:MAG TPA: hypothetical protein PKZ07_14530 [Sedimentisphaerales bacterium]|nr:hypothetical protein [Sedimentisphaerales bacterium]
MKPKAVELFSGSGDLAGNSEGPNPHVQAKAQSNSKAETLSRPRTIWANRMVFEVGDLLTKSQQADSDFLKYRLEQERLFERDEIAEETFNENLDEKLLDEVSALLGGIKYAKIDDLRIEVRIADHEAALSRQGPEQLSYVISHRVQSKGSNNTYFDGNFDEPGDVVYKILSDVDAVKAKLPGEDEVEDEMRDGGMVKGPSHDNGGVKFRVEDTGQLVEVEGSEPVITHRAMQSQDVIELEGTNLEVLNEINTRFGGKTMTDPVTSLSGGDTVICKVSAKDKTRRKFKGTPRQIVSAINESGGCKVIDPDRAGSVVKEMGRGGVTAAPDLIEQWLDDAIAYHRHYGTEPPRYSVEAVAKEPELLQKLAFTSYIYRELFGLAPASDQVEAEAETEPAQVRPGQGDDVGDIAARFGLDRAVVEDQVNIGTRHELEHTQDPAIARKIALDHLRERPDYYLRLREMELKPVVMEAFPRPIAHAGAGAVIGTAAAHLHHVMPMPPIIVDAKMSGGGEIIIDPVPTEPKVPNLLFPESRPDHGGARAAITILRRERMPRLSRGGELVGAANKLMRFLEKFDTEFELGLSASEQGFVRKMVSELRSGVIYNKTQVEKLAATYGISQQNLAKELTELAIIVLSRSIISSGGGIENVFYKLVELYQIQPNLSHRTSLSTILQQYSTPAPMAYLMGKFCEKKYQYWINSAEGLGTIESALRVSIEKNYTNKARLLNSETGKWGEYVMKPSGDNRFWFEPDSDNGDKAKALAFAEVVAMTRAGSLVFDYSDPPQYLETSAGNGMLTIWANPAEFTVNEIDSDRLRNLAYQRFGKITSVDASVPNKIWPDRVYDAVLTNPPFGSIEAQSFTGYKIKALEFVMALLTLEKMSQDGKAAIICGGTTQYDSAGRIRAGKDREFISYLYSRYNVVDMINMDGKKLYQKMGTGFDVRIFLIDGVYNRPEPNYPPLKTQTLPSDTVLSDAKITTWREYWNRMKQHL